MSKKSSQTYLAEKYGIEKEKFSFKKVFSKENFTPYNIKRFIFGSNEKLGFLSKLLIYMLLIIFGFVYIYPLIYMFTYSLMSPSDLLNPTINYIPSRWYFENFKEATTVLSYGKSLSSTLLVSIIPAILQTISCALTGYAIARYSFKGKKIIIGIIIFTFIIPSAIIMFPQLSLFVSLKLVNTMWTYFLPALFGQGIKSAVFILLFFQYFKGIPKSIIEACKIDGASEFKIFIKIAIPSAKSAFILSLILSTVWYYNETVLANLYFGDIITTLPLQLSNFEAAYNAIYNATSQSGKSANEAIYMAGTLLTILPLLLIFLLVQRQFVQGIDKAGLTGE